MFANHGKISGFRWLLAAAMALAAVAGYWCGLERRDLAGSEDSHVPRTRGQRHREVVDKASPLTASELVSDAIHGVGHERQLWRNIRGFSEDEVKTAIAALGNADLGLMPAPGIREMLFYRWGELDPVAANAKAREMYPENFSWPRQAVIAAWIKQGGAVAAWDAVKDEEGMWDCTRSVRGEVAEMLVASFSDRDDATAFREVLLLDDDNSEIADLLCSARAGMAYATPESRAGFLAAASTHPKPFVLSCAYRFLFREWAKRDLEAARAGASAMAIPEDQIEVVRWEVDSVARDKERESAKDQEQEAGSK